MRGYIIGSRERIREQPAAICTGTAEHIPQRVTNRTTSEHIGQAASLADKSCNFRYPEPETLV